MLGILVVPIFNEASRLDLDYFSRLLSDLCNLNWVLLVVNDGSTDNTIEKLRQLGERENLIIHSLNSNQGKANAVRLGFKRALSLNPKISFLGYVDGDCAISLLDISRIIRFSECSDAIVTMSSRVKLAGSDIRRMPFRHFAGRLIATILNQFVLPTHIYDPQCGFKIVRVRDGFDVLLNEPFLTKWFFDVEFFLRLYRADSKAKILEFPLLSWRDVKGGHLSISKSPFILKELLTLIFMKHRLKKEGTFGLN